ncbi:MAG: hypothetical protein R3C00_07845 [Hyphomonas sp.]
MRKTRSASSPAKKEEPEWLLDWRLAAYKRWLTMEEPTWAKVRYSPINYQEYYYYAAPKTGAKYESIDDVPKEILETYEKLGIPLREAEVLLGVEGAAESAAAAREKPRVAVDAVFDSVSVATTFRKELEKAGVIFMSISEAVRGVRMMKKYRPGSVVPQSDNYFATLNSAVFSDSTKTQLCAKGRAAARWSTSTYVSMNAENTGQFDRTLIVERRRLCLLSRRLHRADARRTSSHAAVVELVALDDAESNSSTVQNWWPER